MAKSFERVDVSSERVTKSFERVGVSSKRVTKSFERVGVSSKRVTKSFERVSVSSERVTKSFERMQIFFERFTNGCKRNPAQKRKVVKVRFPVHGHVCSLKSFAIGKMIFSKVQNQKPSAVQPATKSFYICTFVKYTKSTIFEFIIMYSTCTV